MSGPGRSFDTELVYAVERAARESIPALDTYLIASARRQLVLLYLPGFLRELERYGYVVRRKEEGQCAISG